MTLKLLAATLAVAAIAVPAADAFERTPAPADARVYFVTPQDGDTITGPVTVRFGLSGMGVAPAGVDRENTGHHHLVVNAGLPNPNGAVPADENHIHFGGGQTETTLELPPGEHTLQLLVGDHRHIPHDPPIASEVITIVVE